MAPTPHAAHRLARRADLQLLRDALREPARARVDGIAGAGVDGARDQRPEPPARPAGLTTTKERDGMVTMTQALERQPDGAANHHVVIECKLDRVFYGEFLAVRDSHVEIEKGKITGFIGPSGCGKSTVLRSLNRMNDLIYGFRFEGRVRLQGTDVYDRRVDPVAVRRHIGMVFQQPN